MQKLLLTLLFLFTSLHIDAQQNNIDKTPKVGTNRGINTNVPDDNFENYLETHDANGNTVPLGDATSMGNGIANDDFVLTSRVANITSLIINFPSPPPGQEVDPATLISDLTGIADFTNLITLHCDGQLLTLLNISANTKLENLDCSENQISSLVLNSNVQLKNLDCSGNPVLTLDLSQNILLENIDVNDCGITNININNNPALIVLHARNINLTTIDLSLNPNLEELHLNDNLLTGIDLAANPKIKDLYLSDNLFLSLDLSLNPIVEVLYLTNNFLSSLDLSSNPKLRVLSVSSNLIATLDLTANTKIGALHVNNNRLTSLNLKSGLNTNIYLIYTTGNPDLYCINVDDASYSTSNWSNIDGQSYFATNCGSLSTGEFHLLDGLKLFPNPSHSNFQIQGLNTNVAINIIDINGKSILSIKDYTSEAINISNLSKGVYFVHIATDTGVTTKKIIKE